MFPVVRQMLETGFLMRQARLLPLHIAGIAQAAGDMGERGGGSREKGRKKNCRYIPDSPCISVMFK